MINVNKYNGSCNVLDESSKKICIQSKAKDLDVEAFNMITKISETKTLVKRISKDYKCKFDSTACYSNQKWNNDKCQFECKKYRTCKNDSSWNPGKSICENSMYLKNIVDDSVIVCDVIISTRGANVTNKCYQ